MKHNIKYKSKKRFLFTLQKSVLHEHSLALP